MPEQYWGDEAFDDGSPVYGSSPQLYIPIEPWSTSPETTTGRSLRVADGTLFDGIQQLANRTDGLATSVRNSGTAGDAVWVVERQNVVSDSDVLMSPSLVPLAGTPDNDTFKHFGVCSHVSGGTLTSAGEDEYYTGVTGYFLIEEKQSAASHRVLLLELSSGSITVLGNQQVQEVDAQHASGNAFDFFPPRELRLTVEDAGGGQQRVRAYRKVFGAREVQLFDGSAFLRTALADGRCGFGIQSRRTSSGGCDSTGACNSFTIRDYAKTGVVFSDSFARTQRIAARGLTDGTTEGRSLAQAWAGDLQTQSGLGTGRWFAGQLLRDTGTAGRAVTGNDVGSPQLTEWPGYMIRQDSSRERAQRLQVTAVRLNQDTNTRTETGVLMRFNVLRTSGGLGMVELRGRNPSTTKRFGYYRTGYAIYIVHDTSATPAWQLEIRHHNGSTSISYEGDVIATADLTSLGLSIGVSFVFDIEIRNFDGTAIGQGGFVSILTKVNATTITPTPAAEYSGVAVVDSYLVDTRSEATTEAGGWGLYHCPDAIGAGDLVGFLDFASLTLTDPPTISPEEQASVTINAETYGATGTLTLTPEATIRESIVTAPTVHRMESGKTQVIARQPRGRRRWECSAVMERADWEALDTLWGSNGAHTPFNWTHPYTGASYVVLFGDDSLTFDEQFVAGGAAVYSVSFTLDEVFAQSTYNPEL